MLLWYLRLINRYSAPLWSAVFPSKKSKSPMWLNLPLSTRVGSHHALGTRWHAQSAIYVMRKIQIFLFFKILKKNEKLIFWNLENSQQIAATASPITRTTMQNMNERLPDQNISNGLRMYIENFQKQKISRFFSTICYNDLQTYLSSSTDCKIRILVHRTPSVVLIRFCHFVIRN